jgi:hypothetical protein
LQGFLQRKGEKGLLQLLRDVDRFCGRVNVTQEDVSVRPSAGQNSAAKALGHVTGLRLKLDHCDLTVNDLRAALDLVEERRIEELGLCYAGIGNDHMKELVAGLRRNSSVTHLDLRQNPFDDLGMRIFAGFLADASNLKFIDITFCNITDQGATALADAIETNLGLEHLTFSTAGYGDIHMPGKKAIAKALARNHGIRSVEVTLSYDFDDDIRLLCDVIKMNQSISSIKIGMQNNHHRLRTKHIDLLKQAVEIGQNVSQLEFTWPREILENVHRQSIDNLDAVLDRNNRL